MSSLNQVILVGNLGKDPELRHTQQQVAVANFSIATTEHAKDKDFTEWHNIVTWNKTAENCAKFLKKGSKVCVVGRIQTRSYTDKEGAKKFITEIVAHDVRFLSPKSEGGSESAGGTSAPPGEDLAGLDDIPF